MLIALLVLLIVTGYLINRIIAEAQDWKLSMAENRLQVEHNFQEK